MYMLCSVCLHICIRIINGTVNIEFEAQLSRRLISGCPIMHVVQLLVRVRVVWWGGNGSNARVTRLQSENADYRFSRWILITIQSAIARGRPKLAWCNTRQQLIDNGGNDKWQLHSCAESAHMWVSEQASEKKLHSKDTHFSIRYRSLFIYVQALYLCTFNCTEETYLKVVFFNQFYCAALPQNFHQTLGRSLLLRFSKLNILIFGSLLYVSLRLHNIYIYCRFPLDICLLPLLYLFKLCHPFIYKKKQFHHYGQF